MLGPSAISEVKTVFDEAPDHLHGLLYSGSIRAALIRLLPPDFFFSEEQGGDFLSILPLFRWVEWENSAGVCHLSLFLVNRHQGNAVKFFYEMISRWLLPGKRLNSASFFATDFTLPARSEERFTLCEIVIAIEHLQDRERVLQNLPVLETEVRWGLSSVYHANRILEIKGLSADEKTSLIQGRIAALLQRRPADFDHDIFSQMQHFLVMCNEEFKAVRECNHMSRIIYIFYLFRKTLQQQVEISPGQRHVTLKCRQALLHLPLGLKRVLGIFVGVNFLHDNETFEQRHLLEAVKHYFPDVREVEDSCFSSTVRENKLQLLYLEVEREERRDFSVQEITLLYEKLPYDLKNGVEKLVRPTFMPRNEEEVMRNIITLSHQLRYPRDLPQVIISFQEQTDAALLFTIIYVRLLKEEDLSLQEMFQKADTFLKFFPDRVKRVGMLRKRHPKEATVFKVTLSASDFLRQDHSVDLLKARHVVMVELQRIAGEVRDYNGGMIAKQHEQFLSLKQLCGCLGKKEEVLLESFFHSIFPIELRSVVPPQLLKKLFSVLLEGIARERDIVEEEEGCLYVLIRDQERNLKEKIGEAVSKLQISSSQLLSLSLQAFEGLYLGFILQSRDQALRTSFLAAVRVEEAAGQSPVA